MSRAELMRCKLDCEREAARYGIYSAERTDWLELSRDYWRRIVAMRDDEVADACGDAPAEPK